MRWPRHVAAIVALVAAAGTALGDGMVVPKVEAAAMEAGQKAIIIDCGDREVIVFRITYSGAAEDFAWVVPVPGRPDPDDISQGSAWFFEYVYGTTSPKVITLPPEHEGKQAMEAIRAGAGGPGTMGSGSKPEVLEWYTLTVGPYRVSVLSATGKGVLGQWLRQHGFGLPAAADAALDSYVGRGWYFVATTVTPGQARTGLMEGDLPPLVVGFPRPQQLLYPLAISRASTRQWCTLDLVILSAGAVNCREVPAWRMPPGRQGRGSIWDMLCAATDDGARSVLLSSLPSLPLPESAWCAEGRPKPAGVNWMRMWATRLWMRLRREQLADLHFYRDRGELDGLTQRLAIERKPGKVASAMRALRRKIFWPVLLAVCVMIALIAGIAIGMRASKAALLLLLVVSGPMAYGGFVGIGWFREFDVVAEKLTHAIRQFHDRYGAYPKSVADLAATRPPSTGIDASGNEVEIPAGRGWAPLLDEIPVDPASGSRSGWLIDLAAPGLVSSKGFALKIRWETEQPGMVRGPETTGPAAATLSTSLAPREVTDPEAVTVIYDPYGVAGCVWLRVSGETAEVTLDWGAGSRVEAPEGELAAIALLPNSFAPPGSPGAWCIVARIERDEEGTGWTSTPLATQPVAGRPAGLAVLRQDAILAGVATGSAGEGDEGPPAEAPAVPEGPGIIYLCRPGQPLVKLTTVLGLRGLARASDHTAFVVHQPEQGAGHRLSILDLRSRPPRLRQVDTWPVVGGRYGDWVVARDGYAWVVTQSPDGRNYALVRVSATGVAQTMLQARTAEGALVDQDIPLPLTYAIAPGPAGRALALVDAGVEGVRYGGPCVVMLGEAKPRVVARLRHAHFPVGWPAREKGWCAVAWPPETMPEATALLGLSHEYTLLIAVIRRQWPRVTLAFPKLDSPQPGQETMVEVYQAQPPMHLRARVFACMPVWEAKDGWLVAVEKELGFSMETHQVVGVTWLTQKGRRYALVGRRMYPIPSDAEPPVVDCYLSDMALVYVPLDLAGA